MSDGVQVVGGAGGLDAEYADLLDTAAALQSAAAELSTIAWSTDQVLTDGSLLASSLLDPAGVAAVEAAVLAAVAGPHGLLRAAGQLEVTSLHLRTAVLAYRAADELGSGLHQIRQWVGVAEVAVGAPLVILASRSSVTAPAVEPFTADHGARYLTEHPGLVEDVAGGAPTLLQGVVGIAAGPAPGLHLGEGNPGHPLFGHSLEQAAALLASLYPPGSAVVVGRGSDRQAPAVPASVVDLMAGLEHRDARAAGDAQGEIDVRRLTRTGPDGQVSTSWIVDLPGTKSWDVDPSHRTHLNDLATNLTTMAGVPSARVDGLTEALRQAGVGRDEPVMLVGHSQGGLVAMRAAETYAHDGSFRVTHVVTAGSPTARMPVPASVSVLALENRYDLVPRLDGEPAPPEANRVTVVFDAQSHDIGRNHSLSTTYLTGARLVDRDRGDPSLTAWRDGASAFFAQPGSQVTASTTVWDIRNGG